MLSWVSLVSSLEADGVSLGKADVTVETLLSEQDSNDHHVADATSKPSFCNICQLRVGADRPDAPVLLWVGRPYHAECANLWANRCMQQNQQPQPQQPQQAAQPAHAQTALRQQQAAYAQAQQQHRSSQPARPQQLQAQQQHKPQQRASTGRGLPPSVSSTGAARGTPQQARQQPVKAAPKQTPQKTGLFGLW